MNISIAIPTHDDRWCYTSKTIANIHDNEHVVEIILVDDHSSDEIYNRLVSAVKEYPKVKLFRNDTQEFVFLNKYIAVSHCTSDWVALLDSDNIFDCNFIDRMCEQEADSHIIYCPDACWFANDFSCNLPVTEYFSGRQIVKEGVVVTNNFYKIPVSEDCKVFMREKFKPSQLFQQLYNVDFQDYHVIHLRTGDAHHKKLNSNEIEMLKKEIREFNLENVVFLCDNKDYCYLFGNCFNFQTLGSTPIHFGYLDNGNMRETLVDFHVMSKAKSIVSITVYCHISGFAKECAEIYNIPFRGVKLEIR